MSIIPIANESRQFATRSGPAGRSTGAAPEPDKRDRGWLVGFAVAGPAFQIGMYFLGDTPLRMPLRIGVFALSLGFLFFFRRRYSGHSHPAARGFPLIVAVLALGALNPYGAGLLAAIAQATLYIAVLAPLLWTARLRLSPGSFRYVVVILWAFHAASAAMGALQVEYPGRFDGALATIIEDDYAKAMTIVTADGSRVLRPKGLTDSPGGAGSSGLYAIILGFGLLLTERSSRIRGLLIASMGVSIFSIYLSQGRTNLILAAVGALTVFAVLARRGERGRVVVLFPVLATVVVIGTLIAFAVGGKETVKRWSTLTADDPGNLAYDNRGIFLDILIRHDIFEYPLGAGGGRWGMMNRYFGDRSKSLWAEMMWQALLYDGGLPLIALYVVLLARLMKVAWRIAVSTADEFVGCWAAVVIAFNLATILGSFVYPIYIKEIGLQMFLVNACLFGAARADLRVRALSAPPRGPKPRIPAGRLPARQF